MAVLVVAAAAPLGSRAPPYHHRYQHSYTPPLASSRIPLYHSYVVGNSPPLRSRQSRASPHRLRRRSTGRTFDFEDFVSRPVYIALVSFSSARYTG
jgi:hypothetical protein